VHVELHDAFASPLAGFLALSLSLVAKTEAKVALQIIAESKAVYRVFAKGQSSFLFLSSLSSFVTSLLSSARKVDYLSLAVARAQFISRCPDSKVAVSRLILRKNGTSLSNKETRPLFVNVNVYFVRLIAAICSPICN